MPGGSRRCCSRSIPYDANLPADAAERGPRRHRRARRAKRGSSGYAELSWRKTTPVSSPLSFDSAIAARARRDGAPRPGDAVHRVPGCAECGVCPGAGG